MPSANGPLEAANIQLSFAGCGFLCIYHAGVCAAIKEYAPQLTSNRIKGSSAGAIAAAGLLCNVCMSHATSTILQTVTEARAGSLQALSPNFDILALVRRGLEESLPQNAHLLCSGRLFISATRARDYKNVLLSEFDTREELIQAILCSCFIPFYCGRTPPSYRGEQYIDGGFSDNQPGREEPGTVTVSPFSGESDICPSDEDSASMYSFDFCGTSIQFTTQNLFRMVVILFPPSPEVCSRICRQGFDDALRFLTKNHLVPCVKCLTVQSSAIPIPSSAHAQNIPKVAVEQLSSQRIKELRRKRALTVPGSAANLRDECERCMEPLDRFEPPRFSGIPLPSVVQKTLAEMEAKSSASWLNWLRRWRLIRWWLRFLSPPVLLPFELLQFSLKKIRRWLKQTALAPTEAYLLRFQQFVDFLLGEVENRRLLHSPALPGVFPSAVVPVGPLSALRITDSAAGGEKALLIPSVPSQRKISVAQRKVSTSVAPLDLAVPSTRLEQLEEPPQEEAIARAEESARVLQQFCERHDAVLAFHYRDDETNELKICQIFDVNTARAHPTCHDHEGNLIKPVEYFGHEQAQTEMMARQGDKAEDSGLSLEEEEAHPVEERRPRVATKADACCSPVRLPQQPKHSLASRRHTFSSRSARLSASTRTLASTPRFIAPGSRLYASNSMNALKSVAEGIPHGKGMARRKISAQTIGQPRNDSDSSAEEEERPKVQPKAASRLLRKSSSKRTAQQANAHQ